MHEGVTRISHTPEPRYRFVGFRSRAIKLHAGRNNDADLERLAERIWLMIFCSRAIIHDTLEILRETGRLEKECVVLWLGKRREAEVTVTECYRPIQEAESDFFRVPPEGMAALQARLRQDRLMVAAQVHSHPRAAFHSEADDDWAIVRHEGALSLVVPRFAADTFVENFFPQTKVYEFSSHASWDEVPRSLVAASCLQII